MNLTELAKSLGATVQTKEVTVITFPKGHGSSIDESVLLEELDKLQHRDAARKLYEMAFPPPEHNYR